MTFWDIVVRNTVFLGHGTADRSDFTKGAGPEGESNSVHRALGA